jgi:sec-independent protein translocase protein TatC
VVVPAALKFLLHFNNDQFNVQVRASEYYSFFVVTLIALGLVFEVPMGIVAVTRLGIVTTKQLSKNRRYAYFILTVVAMLLPGTDPITMLVELAPLLALFELSLILSRMLGAPSDRAAPAEPEPEPPASPAGS